MSTLWNSYAFFVLYANIDSFNAVEHTLEYDKLTVMDKWILSRLNTMVKTVDVYKRQILPTMTIISNPNGGR